MSTFGFCLHETPHKQTHTHTHTHTHTPCSRCSLVCSFVLTGGKWTSCGGSGVSQREAVCVSVCVAQSRAGFRGCTHSLSELSDFFFDVHQPTILLSSPPAYSNVKTHARLRFDKSKVDLSHPTNPSPLLPSLMYFKRPAEIGIQAYALRPSRKLLVKYSHGT